MAYNNVIIIETPEETIEQSDINTLFPDTPDHFFFKYTEDRKHKLLEKIQHVTDFAPSIFHFSKTLPEGVIKFFTVELGLETSPSAELVIEQVPEKHRTFESKMNRDTPGDEEIGEDGDKKT